MPRNIHLKIYIFYDTYRRFGTFCPSLTPNFVHRRIFLDATDSCWLLTLVATSLLRVVFRLLKKKNFVLLELWIAVYCLCVFLRWNKYYFQKLLISFCGFWRDFEDFKNFICSLLSRYNFLISQLSHIGLFLLHPRNLVLKVTIFVFIY